MGWQIFQVGGAWLDLYLSGMKVDELFRAILPDMLIDCLILRRKSKDNLRKWH